MKRYVVYYMKPDFFRDGSMGCEWLKERGLEIKFGNLENTHVRVREVEADNKEAVYYLQQGEQWSANGEQRHLIESLGLQHTSMSVGDCVVETDGLVDTLYMVDRFGFKEVDARA